ncbi:MAG: YgjV family protein [Clostridia bacterium]|nr:YgjV family protein [Clostridia bacterium]
MIEILIQYIQEILSSPRLLLANGISALAAACMIVACIFSKRKTVFLLQGVQCALLCITQLVLGMYGGLVTMLIGSVRNFLTAYDKMTAKRTLLFAFSIGAAGSAVNFLSDGGFIGLLPVVATVIYTFGCHYIRHPNLMRLNILLNTVLWVGYSLSVLDYITAITNGFTAIIDLLAFIIIFVQESRGRRGIVIGRKQ